MFESTLGSLPPELLVQVLSHLEPEDLSSFYPLSRRFHSPVEQVLRQLASGYGVPETLPTNFANWTQALMFLAMVRKNRRRVACIDSHNAFVASDGTFLICGSEFNLDVMHRPYTIAPLLGRGRGPKVIQRIPAPIAGLAGVRIQSIAAKGHSIIVLSVDGTAFSWGYGGGGVLGHGDQENVAQPKPISKLRNVCDISLSSHALASTSDGVLWSWGCNYKGKLGHGDANEYPIPIQLSPRRVVALAGKHILQVAAGPTSLLVCADGDCYSMGRHFNDEYLDKPVRMDELSGERVINVASSGHTCMAVTARGNVWQWGFSDIFTCEWRDDVEPQKLKEEMAPTQLRGTLLDNHRVVSIVLDEYICLALTADGAVFSWSPTKIVPYIDYSDAYPDYDPRDALGHGNGRGRLRARIDEEMKPRQIEALAGQRICSIGTGSGQSLAITGGDAPSQLAWSWGALFEVHPNLPRDTLDDLRSATSGSFEELEESDMVRMKRYAVSRFGHGDDPHREYYLPHRVSLSSRKHVHMIPMKAM